MFYSLFFTLIFSISVHAEAPKSHEFLNSNGDGFNQLRKCYADLQFSDQNLNTSSRFLKNFNYTYSTPDPSQFDDYKALVIPMKVGNKYETYMFQPGVLSKYPYDDLKIPQKGVKAGDMPPIGNSCELEKDFPLRWDHPSYKYLSFAQDHPSFNKDLNCSSFNLKCKNGLKTPGFRMQLYTDPHGEITFCEDELKTADHGKRSSNMKKGWHAEKRPETLNSKQAMDIITGDLISKVTRAHQRIKNKMKAASEHPQRNQRVSTADLMAAYRASSKNCKGYSSELDKKLLAFEQELITYDPKLKEGDGTQVQHLHEESEN